MTVELVAPRAGGPPQVAVRDATTVLFAGPMPPYLEGPGPWGEHLRGVDLDVIWRLTHVAVEPFEWLQQFRDGYEVDKARSDSTQRVELSLPYGAMVDICYDAMPFEAVLSPDEIAELFAPLSCLTGLLHAPSAPRIGALEDDVVEALVSWSVGAGY